MLEQVQLLEEPQLLFSSIIACIQQLLSQLPVSPLQNSVFDIKTAPTISVSDYIVRMAKYMNASVSVYVYALILLDRAQEYNQHFTIHSRNIHRLLLASNLVSAKYLDDNFYKNSYYATIGGVTLKGLNQLQQQFLRLINFNCHVDSNTFDCYLERLQIFNQVNHARQLQKENALSPKPKPRPQTNINTNSNTNSNDKSQTPSKQKVQQVQAQDCKAWVRVVGELNRETDCK